LQKSGFTIIEIIVVIALMGIVTSLGTMAFIEMTQLWNQTRARAELDARADMIFKHFREDIGRIISPVISGVPVRGNSRTTKDNERFFDIELADDEIVLPVLMATVPDNNTVAATVLYHVEREGGSDTLVRVAGDLSDETPSGARTEVAHGVLRFRVEYAGMGGDADWVPGWSGPTLPQAIRVSLTLADPEISGGRGEQISRKAIFTVPVMG
jgi:prepilin-type N-terminal cleavage/methylation domain-containing protein